MQSKWIVGWSFAALSLLAAQEPAPPAANGGGASVAAEPRAWKGEPGALAVSEIVETWRDEARERDVPVKVYLPEAPAPLPVIVFSHGLGGTRDGYAYLGRHWSSHGYVSLHVQHLGSDDAVWRDNPRAMEAMQQAASDLDNLLGRPRDVSFAIDRLLALSETEGSPFFRKVDAKAIGVAGHSFGAYTTLCIGGRVLVGPLGAAVELADPRVKACVAMSPQGNARERENGTWAKFAAPCFHMTGTRDESPIRGDSKPEERRIPYDAIAREDQYLLILEGAAHLAFSDRVAGIGRRDTDHHAIIRSASTAFFDAYLRGDAEALAWLRGGGFGAWLSDRGLYAHK